MNQNLLLSLQITVLGMGLVFAAIILLSLMMSVLTRFTAEKGDASSAPEPAPIMDRDYKAQAAALAVAMALSEQRDSQQFSEPQTALVSAWQLGMRTRQMHEKGIR